MRGGLQNLAGSQRRTTSVSQQSKVLLNDVKIPSLKPRPSSEDDYPKREAAASMSALGIRNRRIEPSLHVLSNGPVMVDENVAKSSGMPATRPPVVGREMPVDHERFNRYSSSDTHLQEYLKTLQTKTLQNRSTAANEIVDMTQSYDSDDRAGDQQAERTTLPGGRFLKKKNVEVEPYKVELKSMPTSHVLHSSSKALDKALYFEAKYSKTRTPVKSSSEVLLKKPVLSSAQEKTNMALQISGVDTRDNEEEQQHGIVSQHDSTESFLNVKDFDELVSEVDCITLDQSVSVTDDQTHSVIEDVFTRDYSSSLNHNSVSVIAYSPGENLVQRVSKASPFAQYSDDFEDDITKEELSSESSTLRTVQTDKNHNESLVDRHVKMPAVEIQRTSTKACDMSSKMMVCREIQTTDFVSGLGPDPGTSLSNHLHEMKVSSFVDPRRVYHTVGPDAIKILSCYNPSVVALDEILRQQIQSTRAFVESQRRIYLSTVNSLKQDHLYTTWESTKECIKTHKDAVKKQ